MPFLNAKLCASESAVTTSKITTLLTDITATVLKKKRELTSVVVEYVSPDHWSIGGMSLAFLGVATFHLDIKVTEGTNTKDEKAAYVDEIFTAIESVIGKLNPASYVVIHEVRGDAWGYQGATQEYRYVNGKRL